MLMSEEKDVFHIIEQLIGLINDTEQYSNYFNCLLNMISFDASEPHTEPISRKAIEVVCNHIRLYGLPINVLSTLVPSLFKQLLNII